MKKISASSLCCSKTSKSRTLPWPISQNKKWAGRQLWFRTKLSCRFTKMLWMRHSTGSFLSTSTRKLRRKNSRSSSRRTRPSTSRGTPSSIHWLRTTPNSSHLLTTSTICTVAMDTIQKKWWFHGISRSHRLNLTKNMAKSWLAMQYLDENYQDFYQ